MNAQKYNSNNWKSHHFKILPIKFPYHMHLLNFLVTLKFLS
jgi:hypothetical protein